MLRRIRYHFLQKKKNVNGIGGYTDSDGRLPVFVSKKEDVPKKDFVPKHIWYGFRRFKTKVVEVGEVEAYDYTTKKRPMVGGTEISPNNKLWVGTIGGHCYKAKVKTRSWHSLSNVPSWMKEKLEGAETEFEYLGITNRHVALKEFNDPESYPDYYTQPRSSNEKAYELVKVSDMQHDSALLKPLLPIKNNTIVEIGPHKGVKDAKTGMKVRKHGRTSSYTEGTVTARNVTMTINYGGNTGLYTIRGLDMFTAMVEGGDSGSFVVDEEGHVVSLVNAGSPQTSYGIPIKKFLDKLGVSLV